MVNILILEHKRIEVESCVDKFVDNDEAVRDGQIITAQTRQSHPDFYQLVFECLSE
jgi:protease I